MKMRMKTPHTLMVKKIKYTINITSSTCTNIMTDFYQEDSCDDDQDNGGHQPLISVDDPQLDVDQVVSRLPADLLELSPEQESTSTHDPGATPENERADKVLTIRWFHHNLLSQT